MVVRRNLPAFTLIEMLMVILIIAILVALILPAVINSRDKARDVQCRNNLKNLHQAAMNHLYAYNYLPASRSWEFFFSETGVEPSTWFQNFGWCGWRDWVARNASQTSRRPGKPDPWWGREARFCITNIYTKDSDPLTLDHAQVDKRGDFAVMGNVLWEFVGKNEKAYMCPKFKLKVMGANAPDGTQLSDANPPLRSYVMNHRAGGVMQRTPSAAGLTLGSLTDASRILLFADAHTHNTNWALNKAGTVNVRICRQGIMENGNPTFSTKGAAYPTGHYIYDGAYLPANQDTKYRPCPYDCELYGEPDTTAVPARSWPVESVGIHHGYINVNGKQHPFGYGVFVDGHVEQLCWWQTTNACSGNW